MKLTCLMPNQGGTVVIEVNGDTTLQDIKRLLSKTLSVDVEYIQLLLPRTVGLKEAPAETEKEKKKQRRKLEKAKFSTLGVQDGDEFPTFISNKPRALKQYNAHLKKHNAQALDDLLWEQLKDLKSSNELEKTLAQQGMEEDVDVDADAGEKKGKGLMRRVFKSKEDKEKKQIVKQRARRINENMDEAFYNFPESFVKTKMLYIRVTLRGVAINAFIDTGAQVSVMPISTAIKCQLMDIVDPRFARTARGIGTAQIIGRCHYLPLMIDFKTYNYSINVIDFDQRVDLLLGLDFLRSFEAEVDIPNNVLVLNGEKIQFLSETELEAYQSLH